MVRSEKDTLVFLLDEEAAGWDEPEDEPAERKMQLAKLREELLTKLLAGRFASCDELAIKVIAALANLDTPPMTTSDAGREDQLLRLVHSDDLATRSRARRALVHTGSAAFAALLRARLRKGHDTQERRSADVRELAQIEERNYRVMPILRDLLKVIPRPRRRWCSSRAARAALEAGLRRGRSGHPGTFEQLTVCGHVRREVGHAMWKFLRAART